MKPVRLMVAIAIVASLVACSMDHSVSAPPDLSPAAAVAMNGPSSSALPSFVVIDPAAPAIANPVITFWAKRGVESIVYMNFLPRPGHSTGDQFLRFRVRKKSLAFYPNGTPFAFGDSVQITITLTDAINQIVDFQPSGLVFSTANPADLKLSFLEADHDFNQDGVVNDVDAALVATFKVWRLHPPNPWKSQPSVVNGSIEEVETKVFSFTSYAIAY